MTISTLRQRKATEASRGRRQSGFSLVEVAVVMTILIAVVVAGFTLLRTGQLRQVEDKRTALLTAADRAIASFIAINGRLPCPDSTGSGNEDCSTSGLQKGWLPVKTLGLDASAPNSGATRLLYIVYRKTDTDLAAATDSYNPPHWDFYSTPSVSHFYGPYSPAQTSMLDFCKKLSNLNTVAASSTTAYVSGSGAAIINVAYGLADGGMDRDGDGNVFDGAVNSNLALPGFESPARLASATYDDRVIAHGFSDLSLSLNCAASMSSLNVMAQAVEITDDVVLQADSSKEGAIILSAVSGVKALIQIAKFASAIASLQASVTAVSAAAGELAGAIASCFVLVGCFFIPTATAALAAAVVGIGFGATAIALNGAAVAYHVTATVAIVKVAIEASSADSSINSSSVDMASLLPQVKTASDDAAAKSSAAATLATNGRNDSNTALQTYTSSKVNLVSRAHELNPGYSDTQKTNIDPNDSMINAVISSYLTAAAAKAVYTTADGQYQNDLSKYNNTVNAYNAAKTDAQNNPGDSSKQDAYNATITPDSQASLANLLGISNLSAIDRQTKSNLSDTASAAYTVAKNAVFNAYGVFNIAPYVTAVSSAYDDYLSHDQAATIDEKNAADAVKSASDSLNAYNSINNANNNPSGSGSSGKAITVSRGGAAILQEADSRGGLK